jgi:uroporphyrinogen-III synthase
MRVLVTRPFGDAQETSAILTARGHAVVVAPLLDIRNRAGGDIALDGVQALLVTSANGIRALARRTKRRDVKVLAVGMQSADVAREAGFNNVEHAHGDAVALASLAAKRLTPAAGVLVHVAGSETRGDLVLRLKERGFTLRSEVVYDAIAATELPEAASDALRERRLDAVMFYSPRTARIFATLVARSGLLDACGHLMAFCISAPTAADLGPITFREVQIAPHPDAVALLALLD